MACEDTVLNVVFPFLEGTDLAKCMLVCKQWRNAAKTDYFWKCLCAKEWPSLMQKRTTTLTFHQLFGRCYKPPHGYRRYRHRRALPPPKLSLKDLDFYIDLRFTDVVDGNNNRFVFSDIVPGTALREGGICKTQKVCEPLRNYLESSSFKMTVPVQRFTIPRKTSKNITLISIVVERRDSGKRTKLFQRLTDNVTHIDAEQGRYSGRAVPFMGPDYPFVHGIIAWFSMFFEPRSEDDDIDVFGFELDFCDLGEFLESEEQVLWVFDMLFWR